MRRLEDAFRITDKKCALKEEELPQNIMVNNGYNRQLNFLLNFEINQPITNLQFPHGSFSCLGQTGQCVLLTFFSLARKNTWFEKRTLGNTCQFDFATRDWNGTYRKATTTVVSPHTFLLVALYFLIGFYPRLREK